MRFTNELNLPQAFVNAVTNDPYDKGDADYSVTGLIASVREKQLTRRHGDALTEDVADRAFSLYGQVGHSILERADLQAVPERFFLEREVNGKKYRISGKGDSLLLNEGGLLDDFKFCRVWAVLDGAKTAWTAQLNLYRLGLAELFGFGVDRLRIVALIQDWAWRSAGKGKYPAHSVHTVPIETWPLEQSEAYLMERLHAHVEADDIPDNDLPECSDEERYVGKIEWAVMKPGRKSAVKICRGEAAQAEAEMMVEGNPGWFTEKRGGASVRCMRYCLAGRFGLCNQWAAIQAAGPQTESVEADTSALD